MNIPALSHSLSLPLLPSPALPVCTLLRPLPLLTSPALTHPLTSSYTLSRPLPLTHPPTSNLSRRSLNENWKRAEDELYDETYFNDPFWKKQWYLQSPRNKRTSDGLHLDLHVIPAWNLGYTGTHNLIGKGGTNEVEYTVEVSHCRVRYTQKRNKKEYGWTERHR